MKKMLFFIIGFWFAFGNISAQSEQKNSLPVITQFNNEAEIFKYWARRFNVEYTFAYIQDYVKNHPKKTNEKGGWNKIKAKFQKIDQNNVSEFNDFYNNYLISENSLFKKNHWDVTGDKFNNFNNIIDKEINSGSFNFNNLKNSIILYKKKDKKNKFDNGAIFKKINDAYLTYKENFRKIIKNKLTESKKEKEQTPKEITDSKRTNLPITHSTDSSNPIHRKYGSGFFSNIIWFLVGAITMYFLIFFKIKRVLHKEYDKYKTKSKFNFKKDWFTFIPEIGYLKARKDELKNEEDTDNTEQKSNEKKTNTSSPKDEESNHNSTYSQQPILEQPKSGQNYNNERKQEIQEKTFPLPTEENISKLETIYFTVPESDGTFNLKYSYKEKNQRCYYKIKYKKGEKEGEIEYISQNDFDADAINLYEDYLKPVCIIENLEKRMSANFVKMLQPGKVFLSDNKWHIQPNHKIEVEFV